MSIQSIRITLQTTKNTKTVYRTEENCHLPHSASDNDRQICLSLAPHHIHCAPQRQYLPLGNEAPAALPEWLFSGIALVTNCHTHGTY